MPEKRTYRVTANIETTFGLLIENKICRDENITGSEYLRQLIVHDLDARGLLTQELLLRMATTDSVEQLQAHVEKMLA